MFKKAQTLLILPVILLLALIVPRSDGLATSRPFTSLEGDFVRGEVLVQWRAEVSASAIQPSLTDAGLTVLEEIPSLRVLRLAVPPGEEWSHIERLRQHPFILHAEPNYLAYAADGDDAAYPNDPDWLKQWNLRRVAADAAWALSTGKPDFVVAVLDSGVDAGHPDLSANLVAGYDFVNQDADPDDDYGHGTHVAGIIAAELNNSQGIAGVAPQVKIMPLKVLNQSGQGTYANIATAIQYAAANGVKVISLSLGGDSHSDILLQAIRNAYDAGVLLVASTGNEGSSAITYPARYAEVMAISATDHYDRWASYSNWGPEVDLAAPGGTSGDGVWSTWPWRLGGYYNWAYGTSMAVPHVAGAAALIWSVNPALTRDEVADILRQTADQVGQFPYVGGRNDYLGHGRLNIHSALRQALPPSLAVEPTQLLFLGDSRQAPAVRQLKLVNESLRSLHWQAEKLTGGSWLNLIPPLSGNISYQNPGKLTVLASTGGLGYGTYEGSLRITSSTPGAQGSPRTVSVRLTLMPELIRLYLPVVKNDHTHFEWLDATDGTPLSLNDEMSATVELPWSFPFYGNWHRRIWVSDDGFISFGRGYAGTAPDGSPVSENSCLPSARQPNDAIYPFWDDLDPSAGGAIFVEAVDDDTLVIEWFEVPHKDGPSPESFEIVLRRDGRITFQYLSVGDDDSATVGAENYDGTMAWQWLCNGEGQSLRPGMAVMFQPWP